MEVTHWPSAGGLRPQTLAFFDLPREIRDKIYDHHYYTVPNKSGALHRYTDKPSSALLRTCKQANQEALPVFQVGLVAALLHERVCIKLRSKDVGGIVRHAGWTRVAHDRIDVWVRVGSADSSEVGWLFDVRHIWRGGVQAAAVKKMGDEILAFAGMLEKLSRLFQGCTRVERRLRSVYSRVAQVARQVTQEDNVVRFCLRDELKGILKERQSQPGDMQAAVSAMRTLQTSVQSGTTVPALTKLGQK